MEGGQRGVSGGVKRRVEAWRSCSGKENHSLVNEQQHI